MLNVSFTVKFDRYGNIISISRHCRIPIPICEKCKFKKWCDKVESSIEKERNENQDVKQIKDEGITDWQKYRGILKDFPVKNEKGEELKTAQEITDWMIETIWS